MKLTILTICSGNQTPYIDSLVIENNGETTASGSNILKGACPIEGDLNCNDVVQLPELLSGGGKGVWARPLPALGPLRFEGSFSKKWVARLLLGPRPQLGCPLGLPF